MVSMKVETDADLPREIEGFMQEMEIWMKQCMRKYALAKPTEGHDQGTFTTSWEVYLQANADPAVVRFLTDLRDGISQHFTETGKWRHGYWTMQEAHHGTEHYELFLGALLRLNPQDGETIRQLDDAAEHMGNWSSEVPDWFDEGASLYHSMYFGADGVAMRDGADLNVPDHLRCINICLLAYQATANKRYLEHSRLYGSLWARAILSQNELPVGIHRNGIVLDLAGDADHAYRSFSGQLPENMQGAIDRAENIVAVGGLDTMFTLLGYAGDTSPYRQAIEKLLDILVLQIGDPDSGAVAHNIRKYRQLTGSRRYDDAIARTVSLLSPYTISEIALRLPPVSENKQQRPSGIGKRTDLPIWLEDGRPRQHNPILLALAAEISGDINLATRAVQLARIYLNLAMRNFKDGRENGCRAKTISSIARGHGRDNHSGMATAVLAPIRERFGLK